MNIEELEYKHFSIPEQAYKSTEKHTKLSIQFAIEVLEELYFDNEPMEKPNIDNKIITDKIQELKKYLDEKV